MLLFAAERKDAGRLARSYFPVVTGDSFQFCPCLTAIFANLLQPPCSFIVLSSTSASCLSSFLLSLLSDLVCRASQCPICLSSSVCSSATFNYILCLSQQTTHEIISLCR